MRLLSIIISIFLLLPSCKREEVPSSSPEDNTTEKPGYVWFKSNISAEIQGDYFGRAPIDGVTLPSNSEIGVFGLLAEDGFPESYKLGARISGDTECQDFLENAEYLVLEDGKSMQQANLAQWPNKTGKYNALSFYAYYPHSETIMDNEIQDDPDIEDSYYLNIELNSSDMSKTIDYLYTGQVFKTVAEDSDKNVGLTFKHALSRIKFLIETTNESIVSNVNKIVVNANCSKKGKFYIADGTCNPETTSKLSYTYTLNKELKFGTGVEADFLLFNNVKINYITCYINGKDFKIYDSTKDSPLYTLEPGYFLKFIIKFSPSLLTAESSVSEWVDSNNDKNYNIDEEKETVTEVIN